MAGRGRGEAKSSEVPEGGIRSRVHIPTLGGGSSSSESGSGSGSGNGSGSGSGNGSGSSGQVIRGRGGYRNTELRTIPEGVTELQGTQGRPLKFLTNYVRINLPTAARVHQYRVDFEPNVESTKLRGQLVREAAKGVFLDKIIYDNASDLKSSTSLNNEVTTIEAQHPSDQSKVKIIFKKTGLVDWGAFEMLRMYNTAMRGFLRKMGYFQLRRDLYHDQLRTQLPGNHQMSIVGGYRTVASRHDGGVLMNLDSVNKVIQDVTLLRLMRAIYQRNRDNFQTNVRNELVSTTIITKYNNKTYRVEDFKFDQNPTSTFTDRDGKEMSFLDYYKKQYPQLEITDKLQPLILVKPDNALRRQREMDMQQQQVAERDILLLPELCHLTGLTAEQRTDNRLKMDMIRHSQVSPSDRVKNLRKFLEILHANAHVKEECAKWNYSYDKDVVKVDGRQMDAERICWGNMKGQDPQKWPRCDPPGSFDKTVRNSTLYGIPSLQKMAFMISRPNGDLLAPIQNMMGRSMSQIGIPLRGDMVEVIKLPDDRVGTYITACRNLADNTTIVLCLLPNTNKERYDAVKKVLSVERGIPSQCFTAKLMSDEKKANSACQKIAIQMACKIGGEPWTLVIPAKQTMVCGYDTYHDTATRGRSVGAFCSSMNYSMTRWWSKADSHEKLEELSVNLANNIFEGVKRWGETNKCLPAKILVYRDGVSEGQLDHVFNIELKAIKKKLRQLGNDYEKVKLSVIVVTKRIGTRFFMTGGDAPAQNPPPGTVVDSVITRQARYDFYLVSQLTRQGTVSPTMYNVIEDTTGLKPMHQQMLAYKLCHLYFNWTGTVRVPAPCQYAHKLAYLVGESLHMMPNVNLENYLHYL